MGTHKQEHGAVSLFIVIFAALLITVVTVGFIRLMLADQQQATTNDLSQSAYDSAQAGVEDAKRALLRYQNICATGDATACTAAYNDLSIDECNKGLKGVVTSAADGQEVQVQQSDADKALNQAYTCVQIQPQTSDYLGTLAANSSKIISLKSKSTVTTVMIEWYNSKNISNTNLDVDLLPLADVPITGTPPSLYPPLYDQSANGWGPDRPSIMRAQLMQFGSSFTLGNFDNTNSAGESDANTLFLYPTGTKGKTVSSTDQFSFTGRDTRLTSGGSPLVVSCSGTLGAGGYACSAKIDLPTPIGGGSPTAYLRLTPLYNASNYRVTLYNSSNGCDGKAEPCKFDAVQPEIDSTGRADQLFRRVKTRVELIDTNFVYPDSAVDVTGNLCKIFTVIDKPTVPNQTCKP